MHSTTAEYFDTKKHEQQVLYIKLKEFISFI